MYLLIKCVMLLIQEQRIDKRGIAAKSSSSIIDDLFLFSRRATMTLISFSDIESKIIELRQQHVILDTDVAKLYGVETKHINQAVKNNPQKFPEGYIITLEKDEWNEAQKKTALQKSGEIMTELLDDDTFSNESETTIELNFAVVKLKHTIKKNKQ